MKTFQGVGLPQTLFKRGVVLEGRGLNNTSVMAFYGAKQLQWVFQKVPFPDEGASLGLTMLCFVLCFVCLQSQAASKSEVCRTTQAPLYKEHQVCNVFVMMLQ